MQRSLGQAPNIVAAGAVTDADALEFIKMVVAA